METIDPILRKYILISKEVKSSFYLTVIEKELGTSNLREEYYLKEMSLTLYRSYLRSLGIDKIIRHTSNVSL